MIEKVRIQEEYKKLKNKLKKEKEKLNSYDINISVVGETEEERAEKEKEKALLKERLEKEGVIIEYSNTCNARTLENL